MRARAMDSVNWPDITTDIARVRDQCTHCHQAAKSNPMQPPADITPPDYPFQMICSETMTNGMNTPTDFHNSRFGIMSTFRI